MRIEHLAIWAKEIDVLRRFYEVYFGAESSSMYTNEMTGFQSYFLTFSSGARLELMHRPDMVETERRGKESIGYAHLAFSTGSGAAVDALTERLERDGYERISGPRRTGDGYYESVMLDPEGNLVEITI